MNKYIVKIASLYGLEVDEHGQPESPSSHPPLIRSVTASDLKTADEQDDDGQPLAQVSSQPTEEVNNGFEGKEDIEYD